MQNLTLIPNKIFATTSLVTLTLGSSFIANHGYERWFARHKISLMGANAIIKGLILILGFTIIPYGVLLSRNKLINVVLLLLGLFCGFLLIIIEKKLLRQFFRRLYLKKSNEGSLRNIDYSTLMIDYYETNEKTFPYFTTCLAGIFEEILFRGFLTDLCLQKGQLLTSLLLVGVTLIFALNHLNFGLLQVFTKFSLGLICLISLLMLGSIFFPVGVHAAYNFFAVKKYREGNLW